METKDKKVARLPKRPSQCDPGPRRAHVGFFMKMAWLPASIKEHHRASCVPVMARRVASLSRTGLPQYRALGVGATPCRLVSLIHTFGGPYGSSLGVNGACQMKVNRMSLALAAFGQRAAMLSKLAGFGRCFRTDTHPMVG